MRAGRTRRPRLVTPPFLLVMASTFAYFVGVGTLLPVVPLFVEGPLRASDVAVGFAVGSFSLSAIVLRPVAGSIGDRRGRKLLLVGGALLVAVSVAGYLAATSLGSLVALRLVNGAGEAFFFTAAASVIVDLAPEERRGEAVSFFSVALYAGIAVGPALGETVLDAVGFDAVWVLAAGLSVLAAVLALRVPETRRGQPVSQTGARMVHPAGLLPGVIIACSVWGFAGFATFLALYADDLGMGGSASVFLLYSVVVLAIRIFGARIPDRFGAARTVRVSLAVSTLGLVAIWAWARPEGLYAGTALFAVGQALAFPGLMSLAVRRVPPAERGSLIGTFTAFVDVAFGIGPLTLGWVAEATSYRDTFVAAALVTAGGLALFAATVRRWRMAPAPAEELAP